MCNVEYEGKQYEYPLLSFLGMGPHYWVEVGSLNWPKLFQPILKVDNQLTQLLVFQ